MESVASELTKLDSSAHIKDDLSNLFEELNKYIALKRFIISHYGSGNSSNTNSCSSDHYGYTKAFLRATVKCSFYALKFIVLNAQSEDRKDAVALKEKEEKIWSYAKLALFILSVPPIIYARYKDNIEKFYKNTIEYVGIEKDVIKKNVKDVDKDIVDADLPKLSGFALTLASSAVAMYENPSLKLLEENNRDLWILMHIIGYAHSRRNLLVNLL